MNFVGDSVPLLDTPDCHSPSQGDTIICFLWLGYNNTLTKSSSEGKGMTASYTSRAHSVNKVKAVTPPGTKDKEKEDCLQAHPLPFLCNPKLPAHGDTAHRGLCPPHQPTIKTIPHSHSHGVIPRVILLLPGRLLVVFR